MKIVKYANKNYLKMSKSEWVTLGLKNRWLFIESDRLARMPVEEFERRLTSIGWDLSRRGKSDYMAFAPDGITKLTIPAHNWNLRWMETRKFLLRQNRDLEFLYDFVFKVPENFNIRTQKIEKAEQEEPKFETKIVPREQLPKNLTQYDILINNQWISAVEVDWLKYEVMDDSGNVYSIPSGNIKIRKQSS